MSVAKKPELGCKPYYIASGERVKELSDAISRYAENIDTEYKSISKWAKEIQMQCEIAESFDE